MENNNTNKPFLRVTSFPSLPLITVNEGPNEIWGVGGPFGKILHLLAESLRFSYNITLPKNGEYGTLLPNGSVTGMAGMLYNQEADVLIGPYTMTYARIQVVDLFQVLETSPMTILSSSIQATRNVDFTNTVTKVSWKVWVFCLISMGITCLWFIIDVMLNASKRSNTEKSGNNRCLWEGFKMPQRKGWKILKKEDICRYFWEILRIFINQASSGFIATSGTIPKRTVLMCFILVTFFFNAYFGGDLHTDAVVDATVNINSIEELIRLSHICPLITKGVMERLILSGKGSVYDGLRERVRSCSESLIPASDLNTESFYKKILNRKFALIDPKSRLLFAGRKLCSAYPNARLHISREPFFTVQLSIAAGRHMNQGLKNEFRKVLGGILSGGFMLKWNNDIQGILPSCFLPEFTDDEPELTIGDLESLGNMFVVWMSGISLSIATLLFEVLIHHIEKKRN